MVGPGPSSTTSSARLCSLGCTEMLSTTPFAYRGCYEALHWIAFEPVLYDPERGWRQ